MRRSSLAFALFLAAAAPARAQDAAPVIAAERAFAARAAEVGVAGSFLEFMADDAIVFAPGPVNARAFYSTRPAGKTPKDGGPLLAWWPAFAGVARSGDLGFTTGPAELNGKRSVNYLTVWKKQPDGGWKWVYDGGAGDAAQGPGREAPVARMAPSAEKPLDPVKAMDQVRKAELGLARAALKDTAKAYRAALAPDARIQGSPAPPATTPEAIAAALAARAPRIAFGPMGGSASAAGDLAWTYGYATWETGRGYYVRIWRRDRDWRLVFDQILEEPKKSS